jgi:hypothetical protein
MTKTNIGPTIAALTPAEIAFLQSLCGGRSLSIDLGTYRGGSACIMHEAGIDDVTSFDVRDCKPPPLPGIRYVRGNMFLRPASETIINLCRRPEPKLLFCDGGCKAGELLCFAPHLLPGDVAAGHDFHDEEIDGVDGFAINVVEPQMSQMGFERIGIVERLIAWRRNERD